MRDSIPIEIIGFRPSGGMRDGFNFSLNLERDFALRALEKKINPDYIKKFQKNGEDILNQIGLKYPSPFQFQNGSCLIGQINIASDGRWIATSIDALYQLKHRDKIDLKYHTHNLDFMTHSYACLSLFTYWLEYAEILME